MSNAWVAFLAAVSIGTWLFVKVQYRSGAANTRQSVILAGFAGVLIFILSLILLGIFFK